MSRFGRKRILYVPVVDQVDVDVLSRELVGRVARPRARSRRGCARRSARRPRSRSAQRMTSVRSAEPPASRQRIGIRSKRGGRSPRRGSCGGAEAHRRPPASVAGSTRTPRWCSSSRTGRSPRPPRAGAGAGTTMRSLRMRYSSSSNSRWVSSIVALAAPHLVGVGVERQVADDVAARAARRAAAQQRAQAGEQLLALERLDEVVVGAGVEALDAAVERVAGGEHEDRHVAVGAQAPGDLDAVELGQAEVEDDQVGHERDGRRRAPPRRRRRCAPRSPPCAASAAAPGRCPRRPRRRARGDLGCTRSRGEQRRDGCLCAG